MAKKTYKIKTLGCKVNQYDSARLGTMLDAAGFGLVKTAADLVIVNTCAVTKTAIRKAKRELTSVRKDNPDAKIVLMGCWPKAYKDEIGGFAVDLVWGVGNFDKLVPAIRCLMEAGVMPEEPISLTAKTDRTRYFLKIQDGCEQFCTYCVIPYTRGKLKSREEKDVVAEFQQAIGLGYEEIILSGIHLGLYGKDRNSNLETLLETLLEIKGTWRIRLSSIEVGEISDGIIRLIRDSRKICAHLHVPLQSGCDKILKSMNRPYDKRQFAEKISQLRSFLPDIAITTDVIVGFPGETDDDFFKTEEFIKQIGFSKLHVFPFSAHEKTPASKLPAPVSSNQKKARAARLRALSLALEQKYRARFWKNRIDSVCIQKIGKETIRGLSSHYLEIECGKENVRGQEPKISQLTEVLIG